MGRQLFLGGSDGGEEVGGARIKFKESKRRAGRGTRLFGARGLAELRQVASGSAMKSLWLKERKTRSQVVGKQTMLTSWEKNSWEI